MINSFFDVIHRNLIMAIAMKIGTIQFLVAYDMYVWYNLDDMASGMPGGSDRFIYLTLEQNNLFTPVLTTLYSFIYVLILLIILSGDFTKSLAG